MEHQYCLLFKNDQLQFGWIRESKKNRFVVVPEQGREIVCSQSRLEYVWKGKEFNDQKEALSYLTARVQDVKDRSENLELDIIYELCEPGASYTLNELADDFLGNPEDIWEKVALYFRLINSRQYFLHKKNRFYTKTKDEIARTLAEEEKKADAEKRRLREKAWAEQLLRKEKPEINSDNEAHWRQFIKRIEKFLIYLEKSQEKDYFCSLFHCHLSEPIFIERAIIDYLNITGQPLSWGRLQLARLPIDLEYDDVELGEINELLETDILNPRTETSDQRDIIAYTVDNPETKDFDDAISWSEMENGLIVRIHIADVATYVKKDSLPFRKAEARISSLYTVKETYPMFHPNLSEHLLSLKENEDRAVLTFEFETDQYDNITQTKIYRSRIKVHENLTYDEVDIKLEDLESPWTRLWRFCEKRKSIRIAQGALDLDRAEVKLDISDPDKIAIKAIRQNTPASAMIQELAILANHQAAVFAKKHFLNCLFRIQPPYSMNKELGDSDSVSLRDVFIQPARISLKPEGHSALGLDCYLQITSPIRRFLDLVNQKIIIDQLSDVETGFTNDELLSWARLGEEYQRDYAQTERVLLDHWKYKYLAQNQDRIYQAQLMRYFKNGKALINLIDLQLQTETIISGPKEDDVFEVIIDKIKPEYHRVALRQYHPQS